MRSYIIVPIMSVVIGLAGLICVSPSVRAYIIIVTGRVVEWTPEAIEADPVGYSLFAEAQLKKDKRVFQEMRKDLGVCMEVMSKKLSEKSKLLEQGEKFVEDFAEACDAGEFPAKVHGKEYTELQLRSQLGLTLAEVNGLRKSVAEIEQVSVTAELEIQRVVVESEKIDSQLALLATRREIFRARAVTAEGIAILTSVNSVLEGNQSFIKENPVGTIMEIMNRTSLPPANGSVSDVQVDEYLKGYVAKKSSAGFSKESGKKGKFGQTENIPAAPGDDL